MILIDPRNGSRKNKSTGLYEPMDNLFPHFQNKGVSVEEMEMQFGDLSFEGNGPDGKCMIGMERKRITDLINSIRTGRLASVQMPGLFDMYQIRYLIVEGIYRPSPGDGVLEVLWGKEWRPPRMGTSRTPMYSEVSRALTSLQLNYKGLIVLYTHSPANTVFHVLDQYQYFQKKWENHTSHQAFHVDGHVEVFKANLLRRCAKELYKVGWHKSKDIAKVFSSVVEMANASLKEWEQIPGIGKTLAEKIWKELRDEET